MSRNRPQIALARAESGHHNRKSRKRTPDRVVMKKTLFLSLILLALAWKGDAVAQLVTYDFEGDGVGVSTPSFVDDAISAGPFTLSSGTTSFVEGDGSAEAISGIGWNGNSGDKTFSFLVTSNTGIEFELTSLSFSHRRSLTGPTSWDVIINGTPVGTSPIADVTTWFDVNIPLSGFTGLNSAMVTFTGYDAEGSTGTWRLDDVSLDGLAVVPEPSTWLLLAGGSVFLAARLRRRK